MRAGVAGADCDDLVQEVLIVVVRRVAEFEYERPGAFRGWLRSILANHLKSYFRHRARHSCDINLDDFTDPKSVIAQLLDREHDEYLARRAMKVVKGDFSPATWCAFRRQVVDCQSPKDVSQELNLSLNAVIKAKSRVIKRLRLELERLVGD